jgi:hypothetical protein
MRFWKSGLGLLHTMSDFNNQIVRVSVSVSIYSARIILAIDQIRHLFLPSSINLLQLTLAKGKRTRGTASKSTSSKKHTPMQSQKLHPVSHRHQCVNTVTSSSFESSSSQDEMAMSDATRQARKEARQKRKRA